MLLVLLALGAIASACGSGRDHGARDPTVDVPARA